MRSIEKRGRTVEEAIESALAELGVSREDVEIEVLEEPSKGLFGLIGSKDARVRVTAKEPEATQPVNISEWIQRIAESMGLSVRVEIEEREGLTFINLFGKDLGVLIGRRGQTLDALQYLVNLAAGRSGGQRKRIVLDVEGYRRRREITLARLANRVAERVRRTGQSVTLEPMSAHERRVVHTALQGHPYVVTHSEGEEPFRKITISRR